MEEKDKMDKELTIRFLTKEAIKPQDGSAHKDRLWDAIRKANRDVMTGARTENIPQYVDSNKNGNNKTLEKLYKKIKGEKGSLYSDLLIENLQNDNDENIEFAAIQKLVNMTLKYLIVLNECECITPAFNICEEKCDCPVDSIILKKLKKINKIKHKCWTQIEDHEYTDIQKEIRAYLENKYPQKTCGNIWFDFLMWKVD